jgi:murein DD-endopeptidase MepM/ murein hydrolase activator NlpD
MGDVLQGFYSVEGTRQTGCMRVRSIFLAVMVLALFPVAAAADYPHVIQPGETLTSVAAVDGLSIEALAAANGISPESQLVAGQTLLIPPRTTANSVLGGSAAGTPQSTASTSQVTATTTITQSTSTVSDPDHDGDVDASTSASSSETTRASTASQGPTSTQSSTTTGTSATSAAAGGPIPTAERVSAAEITAVADANGVPPALAEAVAWQESGWNNAVVSNVGAVGVMQIVPSTWLWIDRFLTPANPLGTASAAENIRAGVLLLRQLLQLTGGDQQLAVAGYFQGLSSVRRYGMFASTRQYVADVLALAQRL